MMKSIRFERVLLQELHYFTLIAWLFVTVLHGYETKAPKIHHLRSLACEVSIFYAVNRAKDA